MIHPTKIAKELFPLNEDETDPGTVFDWRRRTAQAIEIDRKQRPQVKLSAAEEITNLRFTGYSDTEIVEYLARTNPDLIYREV